MSLLASVAKKDDINSFMKSIAEDNDQPQQQDLCWYDKIAQLDGLSDLFYWKQSESGFKESKDIMKSWGDESKWLIWLKSTETHLQEKKELSKLKEDCLYSQQLVDEDEYLSDLINSNYDPVERERTKHEFSKTKEKIFSTAVCEYSDICKEEREETAKRLISWTNVESEFEFGNKILNDLNGLFECNIENIMKYPPSLSTEKQTMTLSLDNISSNLSLNHGNYMVMYIPPESQCDNNNNNNNEWEVVYGTNEITPINRCDCPFGYEMILTAKSALLDINDDIQMIYEIISHLIDGIHPSGRSLYEMIMDKPEESSNLLKERLSSLGYIEFMNLNWENMSIEEVKQNTTSLVNTIEFRVRKYGRYYFEIHPGVTETNDWMVGLTWKKDETCLFPGCNEYSIGLSSMGKIWFNNTNKYYCPVLRNVMVVGMLVDLNLGYISFIIDGHDYGSSIGWGSETFSIKERDIHIEALRGKSVYPVFALKGEVNSRLNTPQTPMRGSDEINKKNRYGNPEFITEARTAMDESKFPRLSINFGLFDFIYSPTDAYSFDYYLELKKDIDNHEIVNNHITNYIQEIDDKYNTKPKEDSLYRFKTLVSKMHYTKESFSHFPSESVLFFNAVYLMKRAMQKFKLRKIKNSKYKINNMAAIKIQRYYKRNHQNAVRHYNYYSTKIQKIWKGYNVRLHTHLLLKYRITEEKLTKFVIIMQKIIRGFLSRRYYKRQMKILTEVTAYILKAVIRIQRNYRMYKNKKRISNNYRIYRNIIKIQSIWRMYKRQKNLKETNEKEYEKLKKLGKDIVRISKWSKCAVQIQKIWRGYDDRTFARLKRKHYIRASKIIWKAWRTHKLYKYVNGHYDYDSSRIVIKAYVCMKYIFNWRKY